MPRAGRHARPGHRGPLRAIPAVGLVPVPALVAAAHVLRPVRRLLAEAHRITEGDLDARIPVRGNDELAYLTATFSTMAEAIERDATELHRLEAGARRFAADVSHELRIPRGDGHRHRDPRRGHRPPGPTPPGQCGVPGRDQAGGRRGPAGRAARRPRSACGARRAAVRRSGRAGQSLNQGAVAQIASSPRSDGPFPYNCLIRAACTRAGTAS
ncbi:HAMP domain-containing protein [Embleya sp. NPDC059237]|uniref:HAMP domain-containing protein n=1 Tax=Embleya sp. NPDC059237 TaxID=3346784 RepID=UPI0036B33FEA